MNFEIKKVQNKFINGEVESKGEVIYINDCAARGSGLSILSNKYVDCGVCVECVLNYELRKIGKWTYYYTNGVVKFDGNYDVFDYIGVPSLKNGLWNTYSINGELISQIFFDKGQVKTTSFFNDKGDKI